MKPNIKYSTNELIRFIERHLDGISYRQLCKEYELRLNHETFRQYVQRYLHHGSEGLIRKHSNNHYSDTFKKQVVQEYVKNKGSYQSLAIKYNIPSHKTIQSWVMRYTEGKENRTYSPKPGVYQMKSRKTTYEERIEIVEYILNHNLSYKDAAETFNVSYNNVYSWFQKYKKSGPKALEDNRGKQKASDVQTDAEQSKAEIETLKARNRWLEMENEILKKQEQKEREVMGQKSAKKRRTKRSKH